MLWGLTCYESRQTYFHFNLIKLFSIATDTDIDFYHQFSRCGRKLSVVASVDIKSYKGASNLLKQITLATPALQKFVNNFLLSTEVIIRVFWNMLKLQRSYCILFTCGHLFWIKNCWKSKSSQIKPSLNLSRFYVCSCSMYVQTLQSVPLARSEPD